MISLRPAAAAAFAFALTTGAVQAQTGLVVVAHGASPEWNGRVRGTVAQVKWTHGPVAVAFLMGAEAHTAGWDQAIDSMRARGAKSLVVVPLLVSTHGFHYDEIEYYAGLRDTLIRPPPPPPRTAQAAPPAPAGHTGHTALPPAPARDTAAGGYAAAYGGAMNHPAVHNRPPGMPAVVTPAIDAAPELGAVILSEWSAFAPECKGRGIMFVAHGPSNDADANRWVTNIAIAAQSLRGAGYTGSVRVGLLRDDAPAPMRAAAISAMRDTIQAMATRTRDSVVVIPVLISSGAINRVTIPSDLKDLPIRYHPVALSGHNEIARWIERVAGASKGSIN
jgi:sirohydrochlorin ferrochelatase